MAQSNPAKQEYNVVATPEHAAAWKAAHPQPQTESGRVRTQGTVLTGCYDVYYGPDYKTRNVEPDDTYEYSYCDTVTTPDPTGGPGSGGGGGCPPATSIAGVTTASACIGPVAYQGKAVPGKPCNGGGGAVSGPIGLPMGPTDTGTGPKGDEVNNVFIINVSSGNGKGAGLANGGFLLTTFAGETWYELPISLPVYNGPVYIDLGNNISIVDGGGWSTGTLFNDINNALTANGNSPTGFTQAVISEIQSELSNIAKNGTSVTTPDCFAGGAWDGTMPA
jgi:hypothetical protein